MKLLRAQKVHGRIAKNEEEKFEIIENAGVDCKDKESAWVADQNSKPDLAESCEENLVTQSINQ